MTWSACSASKVRMSLRKHVPKRWVDLKRSDVNLLSRPLRTTTHAGRTEYSSQHLHPSSVPKSFSAFTISVDNPATAVFEDVVSILRPSARVSSEGSSTAVVLLATPSFERWIEPHRGFLKRFLQKVLGYNLAPDSTDDITVYVGVVDRVSTPPDLGAHSDTILSNPHDSSKEGFAYVVADANHVMDGKNLSGEPVSDMPKSVGILLKSEEGQSFKNQEIRLPLANTIFINGRKQTLYKTIWYQRSGATNLYFQRLEHIEQVTLVLPSDTMLSSMTPGYNGTKLMTPLSALTLPRKVATGIGNVIRGLVPFGDSMDSKPASEELEISVQRYFSVTGIAPYAMPVWALILPAEIARSALLDEWANDSQRGATEHERQAALENRWLTDLDANREDLLAVLEKGASLHRVLGGGGGWGRRAGLLSLDPNTSLSAYLISPKVDNDHFDFDNANIETALPSIASVGSYVQFYTSSMQSLRSNAHLASSEKVWSFQNHQIENLDLGVLPQNDDFIQSSTSQDLTNDSGEDLSCLLIKAHFGILSYGAMTLSSVQEHITAKGSGSISDTSIDVPFSRFNIVCGAMVNPQARMSHLQGLESPAFSSSTGGSPEPLLKRSLMPRSEYVTYLERLVGQSSARIQHFQLQTRTLRVTGGSKNPPRLTQSQVSKLATAVDSKTRISQFENDARLCDILAKLQELSPSQRIRRIYACSVHIDRMLLSNAVNLHGIAHRPEYNPRTLLNPLRRTQIHEGRFRTLEVAMRLVRHVAKRLAAIATKIEVLVFADRRFRQYHGNAKLGLEEVQDIPEQLMPLARCIAHTHTAIRNVLIWTKYSFSNTGSQVTMPKIQRSSSPVQVKYIEGESQLYDNANWKMKNVLREIEHRGRSAAREKAMYKDQRVRALQRVRNNLEARRLKQDEAARLAYTVAGLLKGF